MQAIEEDQINEKLKEVYECELSVDIRFTKKEQIGEGAFGSVHPGKNMKTGEHLAIKIEKKNDGYTQISQEYKIYKVLESKRKY
jgi:serine/threonine protein kinase